MPRPLTIVADDYGMGRETSRGILDLAREGRITATVLIVNCDDAARAVREWQAARPDADLGWHPNLTLDRPLLSAEQVSSLVRPDGTFWPLGPFLKRVCLGQIRAADVLAEWRAQYQRFIELAGHPPDLVNSHQHVSLFPPCRSVLWQILTKRDARPYVRRVVEPGGALARVPGARVKRTVLSVLGGKAARAAARLGLPGCDWLAGVTDPACVADAKFWRRWIGRLDRGSVEVCCHPGYRDATLVGRDCDAGEGLLRREREAGLLRSNSFREACTQAGLNAIRPSQLPSWRGGR